MEQLRTSLFQQALDVVEKLPPEDQEMRCTDVQAGNRQMHK